MFGSRFDGSTGYIGVPRVHVKTRPKNSNIMPAALFVSKYVLCIDKNASKCD